MGQAQRAAFSEGTRANFICQWKAYALFCHYFSLLPLLPADLDRICMYVQFLSRSMSSPSSWKSYVGGVKVLHLLSGYPFPHLESWEYKLLVKGAAKLHPFTPRQALPITPAILLDIFQVLDFTRPVHVALWSAFVVGFFLFARKSNLVPPSMSSFDPSRHLCRGDIRLSNEGILVHIKWSKTIQAGERYVLVPLAALPGSPLCPLQATLSLL